MKLKIFLNFSADVDAATLAALERGQNLMFFLKQGKDHPFHVILQIVTLYAALRGFFPSVNEGSYSII